MELVVSSSPTCNVLHLVARYARLLVDKQAKICQFSENGRKLLGLPELPVLATKDSGILTQPLAMMNYLASKSKHAKILQHSDPVGRAMVDQWLDFAAKKNFCISDVESLEVINNHLESRTFMVASNVTLADLALYPAVHTWIATASHENRVKLCNVTRWFDHMQHLPGVSDAIDGVPLIEICQSVSDSSKAKTRDAKGEGEKKSEENSKEKKEPKEKKGKENNGKGGNKKEDERPIEDVSRLEVRVGKIVKVWEHPEAEKLFCEEIDIGEEKPRKIASGLRPYLKKEEMEGAMVIVLANLKPRSLKGFESHGMVLCASNADKTQTQLVRPPAGAKIGELVQWEGYMLGEPDSVLNPKKDAFGKVQPHFNTNDKKQALFKDSLFMTSAGPCTCDSITMGTIS